VLTVPKDAPVQKLKPRPARPAAGQTHGRVVTPDGEDALRAGLLALEAGSYASALQWLRRATFRDPNTAVGQFALASAYLGLGDTMRAQAALVYADRLLAGVADDDLAPVTDTLSAATLREAVQAHLAKLASP
jgi:predicted Zn-dependent protease